MPHGVIFDMDGVLVASGNAHMESWKLVAKQHGKQISDEDFRRTFGRPSRDIIRILWGEELSDEEIRRIDEEKENAYRELITGMVPLTVGVREVLTELNDAGFRLAVATSGPPENVELVLTEGRLESFFHTRVTGADIKNGKPAADCFLLAAKRIECDPASCAVIEDAPVGIEAANAAGAASIALVGTHPHGEMARSNPTAVIENLNELTPQYVAEIIEQRRKAP